MDTLTSAYRAQNATLRARTMRDLIRLWPALDIAALNATFPAWFAGASLVIGRDRATSAGLAASYLRAHRAAAGVLGTPTIHLAAPAVSEQVATAMRVTTVVAVNRALRAGKTLEMAKANAFIMSSGAATRLVLDAGRETISASAVADRRTAGWQRVGVGRCDFCQMLLSRGAVYTEATADFQSHDHCGCTAEPVYR